MDSIPRCEGYAFYVSTLGTLHSQTCLWKGYCTFSTGCPRDIQIPILFSLMPWWRFQQKPVAHPILPSMHAINDILIEGNDSAEVKHIMEGVWEKLITSRLEIPSDTPERTEHAQKPLSKKEFQQLLGAWGYWYKQVTDFSVILTSYIIHIKKENHGNELNSMSMC